MMESEEPFNVTWRVCRQDTHGYREVLVTGLPRVEADEVAVECGRAWRDHIYWVEPEPPPQTPSA